MRRVAVVAVVIALGSCEFAQKHPGVTIGVTAGTIGFGACGLAVGEIKTCGIVGGIAGLALGGITGLAMLFARDEDHALPPFQEDDDAVVRTYTEPPPGLPVDAGVPMSDAAIAADAVPAD